MASRLRAIAASTGCDIASGKIVQDCLEEQSTYLRG
jgi:hypothetical protein